MQVVVDVFFIRVAGCDPVGDSAGGVHVLIGIEKHVLRIIPAAAVKHTAVERVEAEDPVELVLAEGPDLGPQFKIVREKPRGEPGGRGHPPTPAILPPPPGSTLRTMGEEEACPAGAVLALDELPA